MTTKIFFFLKSYGYETYKIDRLIISAFIHLNKVSLKNNTFLKEYLIEESNDEYKKLCEFISVINVETKGQFQFENLIELFEFVISPADKEINGAVYTPVIIRDFILENIFKREEANNGLEHLLYADIACGCGSFLIDIAIYLKKNTLKTFKLIFKENLYGLDIQEFSITRTKLLLTLLAISDDEDEEFFDFNLFIGNALSFNWKDALQLDCDEGIFDVIVGNPPYVGASKIEPDTRSLLKNWSVSGVGKADLYIPFFQVALSHIKKNGILGYITVNSFFKSLNGRTLRQYLNDNKFKISIIDFRGEQIFKRRSTYTCICIIQKVEADSILYTASKSVDLSKINSKSYVSVPFAQLDNSNGWLLRDKVTTENILKIQSTGKPLGSLFEIKNGFATLQNDIYLFSPEREDQDFFYFYKNGVEWGIEKGICKPAIKPNILKTEADILEKREMLIFPYTQVRSDDLFVGSISVKLFSDEHFKRNFPNSYYYLQTEQTKLAKRDNGNKKYENWFAFGRNQALTLTGNKLLFPYISNKPYFVFTDEQELFFYNGYAIFGDSEKELLVLKKVLSSSIFWYYIINASKPYENEYFSLAKNYIKHFGVCKLSDYEKDEILTFNSSQVDKLLKTKYNIDI